MAPSEPPAHEIIVVSTPEERQQCYDIRIAVFHHEQKFPLETEIDDKEDVSTHFLLRLTPSLVPVGTIRTYTIPDPNPGSGSAHAYKLTRLAVLQEYRQFRFGRALVLALHAWVRAHELSSTPVPALVPVTPATIKIVAHSQIPAKGFYAKFGYAPEGAEFDEDGDPHQKMDLQMPLDPSAT